MVKDFLELNGGLNALTRGQIGPGRNLGKTNPLNDEDLAEFVKLQKTLADSPKSWTVNVKDIDKQTFDLSVKNPNGGEEIAHQSPEAIMDEIAALDACCSVQSSRVGRFRVLSEIACGC